MNSKNAATVWILFMTVVGLQAASPFKKTSGNGFLHTSSHVSLPHNVGLFERVDTHIYGSQGRDVSAKYYLDRLVITDTYIYPVGTYGRDLNSEFKIQETAIQTINKNPKLISKDDIHVNQNGRSVFGLHANYQLTRKLFADKNERCGSQLFVFRDGSWFIAYRFSYPLDHSTTANKHVGDFLRQWHWRT